MCPAPRAESAAPTWTSNVDLISSVASLEGGVALDVRVYRSPTVMRTFLRVSMIWALPSLLKFKRVRFRFSLEIREQTIEYYQCGSNSTTVPKT